MVRAVEKSRVFLILRRSPINRKQDLETDMIRHRKSRIKNNAKTTSRLSWSNSVIVTLEGNRREGSDIFR